MHQEMSPDGSHRAPAPDALDEVYYSLPTTRPEHRPGYRPDPGPAHGSAHGSGPAHGSGHRPESGRAQEPGHRREYDPASDPVPAPAPAPLWEAADRGRDPRSAEPPASAPPYEVAPFEVPDYDVPPFPGPSTYDEPVRRSVPLRPPAPEPPAPGDQTVHPAPADRGDRGGRTTSPAPADRAGSAGPAAEQEHPARDPDPAEPGAPAPADPRQQPATTTGSGTATTGTGTTTATDIGTAPDPAVQTAPLLGAPWFSGPKPPLYAPEPRAAVSVRGDADAALVPDLVVDGATHGPLTVRAASVRGDSHRYHGEPRQDSLCVALLGEAEPARAGDPAPGLLLLAVADGVGSARRSHVGSQAVCRDLAEALDRHADELAQCVRDHDELALTALVNSALGTVGERLAQRAAAAGDRPEDYATTLRVLLVPLDPHVRGRGFFAVGDGGAALLREGRWYLDVDVPADAAPGGDGGGIIDTRTAALPTTRHTQARILGPALPGDLFVLCTDGLSTPLAGDPGIREFLADNWGPHTHIPGPVDFLWQLQYRVKSYDDDRTAVCLWEGP